MTSPFEPYVPEGFAEFWRATMEEANSVLLQVERKPSDHPAEHHRVEEITFLGMDGEPLHGWLAIPHEPEEGRGFVWVPPYGRESLLPNAYGTRRGLVSLSFNFFGHGAFYRETYRPERGYFAEGVESPATWVFRRMAQHAHLALRALAGMEEVDPSRLGVMGMSQGAGISIWMGAWSGIPKAVCADMPFLAAMRFALSRNAYRYPLKELIDRSETLEGGKQRILDTLSFFDTLNQATFCRVPTHLSLGLKDPAVRPETAQAVFDALAGEKRLERYDVGHDWYPPMIENNRSWLMEHL